MKPVKGARAPGKPSSQCRFSYLLIKYASWGSVRHHESG